MKSGNDARFLTNRILAPTQISPISSVSHLSVEGMCEAVISEKVSGVEYPRQHVRRARYTITYNKENGPSAKFLQQIEDRRCSYWMRAVVERQQYMIG
jgi:hypothetical protein